MGSEGFYARHFPEPRQERAFLSAVGFTTSFATVRAITHSIRAGIGPFHNLSSSTGRHIHHSTFGIFGLLGVGYLWTYRSGIASGTRAIAMKLWHGRLPDRPLDELVCELYEAENQGKAEPSGSQDMIGLIYPGVNRLDYDYNVRGGVFTSHIESCNRPIVARWLGHILYLLSVEPRPDGY